MAHLYFYFFKLISMSANDNDKKLNQQNENDSSSEVIVKAINYPPGYPDKEQSNKNDEKHRNSHPIHCHHMQPMLSATNALIIDIDPDYPEQNSKK